MRKFLSIVVMVIMVSCAGCTSQSTTSTPSSSVKASQTATPVSSPSASVAPLATSTAASTTAVSADFKKLLESAVPTFTDTFETKSHTPSTIASAYYKQTVSSTRNVSYVEGVKGNGVYLNSYSSYVGYQAGLLNASEGTIRFYWKPEATLYTSYNTRQSIWVDYSSYKPPFSGFLVDTVGWNAAFKGGFAATLGFQDGNATYSNLSFSTWSGSAWSATTGTLPTGFKWDSSKWYDIVISYSKSKGVIQVYVDSVLVGTGKYNTDLSTTEGFFLGQDPWVTNKMEYWPYGPHAMKGTYSYLRIYNQALIDSSITN